MKIKISETVDVTDAQRVKIASVIDQKPFGKRAATREEMKEYIWTYGEEWPLALADRYFEMSADDEDVL